MYASEKMLYWFHAYDNDNYARHFSYYWASKQALPEQHPTIYEEFKEGGFSVQGTIGFLAWKQSVKFLSKNKVF